MVNVSYFSTDRNAIDVFDENAFIDHLKTLFPSKEEVAAVEGKVTAVDGRVAAIEGLNLGVFVAYE